MRRDAHRARRTTLDQALHAQPNAHQLALANLAVNLPVGMKDLDEQGIGNAVGNASDVVCGSVEQAAQLAREGLSRFLT